MDYLLTEIVKTSRENLASKKKYLCQRANRKENNNNFLNEIKGRRKDKLVRDNREPFSSIIVQNEDSSIIQQFREAPSAYIFFVNELIHNFIEIRQAALYLEQIFNKLKDHFWGDSNNKTGLPYINKNQAKMNVNIEIEHMALFFHDIMKDQAIYKIMKSAQQTLDDDKQILLEYKVFKDIIKVFKRIYAYCKQCYKVALIRQKFEEPNKNVANGEKRAQDGSGNCCGNKNCKNCYPNVSQHFAIKPSCNFFYRKILSTTLLAKKIRIKRRIKQQRRHQSNLQLMTKKTKTWQTKRMRNPATTISSLKTKLETTSTSYSTIIK